MAYQIKDEKTLGKLRHLAKVRKTTVADVLREAVDHEAEREIRAVTTMQLLRPILERSRALGTEKAIDWEDEKRRSDELWGQ